VGWRFGSIQVTKFNLEGSVFEDIGENKNYTNNFSHMKGAIIRRGVDGAEICTSYKVCRGYI